MGKAVRYFGWRAWCASVWRSATTSGHCVLLYKRADVIVFDEATSALDNNTESAVMKSLESLGNELTLIIVAHRLTTLRNCTHVIELENGEIKQSGSYDKVIDQQVQAT